MTLVESVCRALCEASVVNGGGMETCRFCRREKDQPPVCEFWPTFEAEARAAISAVRKSDRGR